MHVFSPAIRQQLAEILNHCISVTLAALEAVTRQWRKCSVFTLDLNLQTDHLTRNKVEQEYHLGLSSWELLCLGPFPAVVVQPMNIGPAKQVPTPWSFTYLMRTVDSNSSKRLLGWQDPSPLPFNCAQTDVCLKQGLSAWCGLWRKCGWTVCLPGSSTSNHQSLTDSGYNSSSGSTHSTSRSTSGTSRPPLTSVNGPGLLGRLPAATGGRRDMHAGGVTGCGGPGDESGNVVVCSCGQDAKLLTVKKAGPNTGEQLLIVCLTWTCQEL